MAKTVKRPSSINDRRNYVWPNLGLALFGLVVIGFVTFAPMHRWVCSQHAGNATELLDWTVLEIRQQIKPLAVRYLRDDTGFKDELLNLALGALLIAKQDSAGLGSIPAAVDSISIVDFPKLGLVAFRYHDPVRANDLDSASTKSTLLDFGSCVGRYGSRNPDQNRAQLRYWLGLFVEANRERWPNWSADSSVTAAFNRTEAHIRFPLGQRQHGLIVFFAIFPLLYGLGGYLSGVTSTAGACRKRRLRSAAAGDTIRGPWPLAVGLIGPTRQAGLDRYERWRQASLEVQERRRRETERQRSLEVADRRGREREARRVAELDEHLIRVMAEFGPPETWKPEASQHLLQARDVSLPLHVRWANVLSAVSLQRQTASQAGNGRPVVSLPAPLTYEERLRERVLTYNPESLSAEQRAAFLEALDQYESERETAGPTRQVRLLERALQFTGQPTSDETVRPVVPEPAAERPAHDARDSVRSLEEIETRLGLDELLPPGICSKHATAIVLALLRPGRRGGAAFNAAYHTTETIRRKVYGKLSPGGAYDGATFDRVFRWLFNQHIVVTAHGKRHREIYSLNGHVDGKIGAKFTEPPSDIGRPIVERIVRVYQEWTRATA